MSLIISEIYLFLFRTHVKLGVNKKLITYFKAMSKGI